MNHPKKSRSPLILPSLVQEQDHWQQGRDRIAGVDEVGRGCLAGPVVAAALILPKGCAMISGVQDSKKVSPSRRSRLDPLIRQQAIALGFGLATVLEIEQLNILQATYLAMKRALDRVSPWDHALIDGKLTADAGFSAVTAIVGGDRHCYSISCAAIVAKVRRDRLMVRLGARYPGYGWERNMGYGTKEHFQGIKALGLTPWHRRTFIHV
ncbi:ribonuclease HII [Candidatus Synechococcus calcipolaris G9]|uniref:Ribonuclease HII n=1 Tax=Candidatus Synechococcus calcipolaris G9 TaxID=1497997 RepID=A0ABT6F1Z6_9SYNE|nr:ribonuclease HII [Candidatus Synechococcus calcipolaris]MDG2991853.1 ribonuclease HII [Candidatus Synechococcus calcipolaris G9]